MGAVISADRPAPNSLHQALRERALERVELVMKVALLVGAGFSRGEIGPPLDMSHGQAWRAVTDLQAVAERVDLAIDPARTTSRARWALRKRTPAS
jgi:hypothetical protein